MKTYHATDPKIYPQKVTARPMNSMTHAIQIEGIDPLEYDEHGLAGYYATWQDDGKDCSAWFPDDVFTENFKPAHSVPNTVTVNINTDCETQAIEKAKQFADMFYSDTTYPVMLCEKAKADCYVVVMGMDKATCAKKLATQVKQWRNNSISSDKVTEVAHRVLHQTMNDDTPSIKLKTTAFFAVLLSAVCLLGYCSQQVELELTQKELTQCK